MEPVGDTAAKYSTKPGSWRIAGIRYLPVSRVMRSTSSKRAGSKVPRDTRITAVDASVIVVIEQYSSTVPLVRGSRSCLLRVGQARKVRNCTHKITPALLVNSPVLVIRQVRASLSARFPRSGVTY